MDSSIQNLIEKLNHGDHAAFKALFEQFSPRVYNFALRLLENKFLAEDICQTCFINIWQKRQSIDPNGNFSALVFVMAKNAAFNELRRLKYKHQYTLLRASENEFVEDAGISEKLDFEILSHEVEELSNSFPQSRRRIFNMRYKEGLSVKEIAKILDISPKTVETQLSRIKTTIIKNKGKLL